jgi:hypothetical protein
LVVERFSVVSAFSFDAVVARIESGIAHPDPRAFAAAIEAAPTRADAEVIVARALGPYDFMEIGRIDVALMLRKEPNGASSRMIRFLLGNPRVVSALAPADPDVGLYAPLSVLVDQRADGVTLSYDRMATLLAPLGDVAAARAARALDDQVERFLTTSA